MPNRNQLLASLAALLFLLSGQALAAYVYVDEGNLAIYRGGYYSGSDSAWTANTSGTYTIRGTTSEHTVTVYAGEHDITLYKLSIDASELSKPAFLVKSGATVHLKLTYPDTLIGGEWSAGLQVEEGATLEITSSSTSSLVATGGYHGAGIGDGNYDTTAGSIVINGGEIIATGGWGGAGIGGGYNGSVEAITINDGTITAIGGEIYGGAGIGGGGSNDSVNVTITGGTITATGFSGAGIGGGSNGSGVSVEITGGTVTATGGSSGIGGGSNGSGVSVKITGGEVTATGSGSGIGGGSNGSGVSVEISGGTVTATGSGSGIGGGSNGSGVSVEISGGEVTATGGGGAGIGGGVDCGDVSVEISGGMVRAANSRMYGSGVGGGWTATGDSRVKISGGTVIATGGTYASAIGSGYDPAGADTVTISGGIVLANPGKATATLAVDSGAVSVDSASVLLIENLEGDTVRLADYAPAASFELAYSCTWPEGYKLVIGRGDTLSIGSGDTLTNEDTIYVYGGLNHSGLGAAYGELENNGAVIYLDWEEEEEEADTLDLPSGLYLSGDTLYLDSSVVTLGEDFTLDSGYVLVVAAGETLVIAAGATLTYSGTVNVYGTLTLQGSVSGTGTLNIYGTLPLGPGSRLAVSRVSGAAHGVRVRSGGPARVGVYDLRGALVKAQNVTAGETLIGGLKPGAYLVRLSGGAGGLAKVR